MATNVVAPINYYSRHVLPQKIISNRPRQPKMTSFSNVVVNVDEIPSAKWSQPDSNKSQRWNRSSAIADSMPSCCKWGMITTIIILTAGLITVIALLFMLSRNQTNDSNG
ncbi:unnamed protein product [Rotaria sp. Silwood1]|nr:unnamed protein product [Rotaria sp. Silwood1]